MKGILFDLDGTLIDSMHVWQSLDKYFVESRGLVYDPKSTEELKAIGLNEAPKYFNKVYGMNITLDDMMDFMYETLESYYSEKFELKPGVYDKLTELHDMGIKMCITTATDSSLALKAIDRLGLSQFMQFTLTPDIAGLEKGEFEFFRIARSRLGTEAHKTYVFDDALYALENAVKLGMIPVGVEDFTSIAEQRALRKISKIYLEGFHQLDVNRI